MRQKGLPCVLIVLLLVLGGVFSLAATNPLTGSAPERPGLVAEGRPSLLMEIGRVLLKLQRDLNREIGRHMRAIRDGDSRWALVGGLAFAFLCGVLHALGPGHGKFVVVSYFISRKARIWRGLLTGLQISVTHVISAFVLLWLADMSLKTVLGGSPAAMRDVQLLSYGATAAIGLVMLVRAVQRSVPGHEAGTQRGDSHHGHGGKQLSLVSFSVGLVPCTGALLVMLFALANDMVFTGTVMVAAIAAGMAVTMSVLGILEIEADSYQLQDGSGLSRENRLSAAELVSVLEAAVHNFPWQAEFMASLGLLGLDGVVERGFSASPARGLLRGKTGSLQGVTALSGYGKSTDGKILAFSLLWNGSSCSSGDLDGVQADLAAILSGRRQLRFR